jgi:hypothetical protein
MSSILEALERAEEERLKGEGPAMRPLPVEGRGGRISGRLVGLILLLVVLLNLVFWLLYRPTPSVEKEHTPPQAAQTGSSPAVVPPAPVAPEPRPAVVQSQPAKPPLSVREQLKRNTLPSDKPLVSEAVVARPSPAPPAAKPAEPLPERAQTEAEAPLIARPEKQAPRAAEKPQTPVVATAPPREMPIAPVAAPFPTPVREEVAPAADEAPQEADQIPLVWELPQTLREKVLQLKSSVHVYSKTPAERFVIINMHRYAEGDTLPPDGFRLERIEREGLVIDYGDGLVRLQRR